MRLMCDIIALAFQTDRTRVATLLLCRDLSGLFYPFLDVRTAHHPTSHYDTSDDYERVTRYYVSQLAYLADRLSRMPEGDTTVPGQLVPDVPLETCGQGASTTRASCPCCWSAAWGGTIKTGRVLDYTGRGDENRKLCSLHLSLMNRMGVKGRALR